ncbi:WYL domain-containing protein [Bacillus glycinifermentans]|uniref:WYL domain-containing protein n=1 Tax=Bacillus glycinifermentans TaxID=1664069 RepID=UPI001FF624C6|nr:WYL domain-containing protein [Bacillus glycinifermentans]MEC3608586.1 WYL domain-containing protein [Bacillus glycinifermentans]UOY87596.1 WYL domain-containing protein [Bacillus glycinifermentans]
MKKLLNRAMAEGFPVEIIYMKKHEFSKRTILVSDIKNGYVKAFCFHKQQVRLFKVDSILAVFPIKKRMHSAHHA